MNDAGGDGAPTGDDEVRTIREAGEYLGIDDPYRARARLAATRKQLDDTIEVQSSFLVSVAYDREAPFLQLEFERDGPNWIYWYGGTEEYRFWNFLQADSKGKYFNKYIRGEYPYTRVQ